MNCKVKTIPYFDKRLKRLVKKFPSLKREYQILLDSLETEPVQGTPLGNNCYKIRIAVASKSKGKSGGARVITHILVVDNTVYLLDIYDKSEHSSIEENEILRLIKEIE